MKCPNCGAEANGKFCEYCGSEMLKDNNTVNITNNYYGNSLTNRKSETDSLGSICPRCGGHNIKFRREQIISTTQASAQRNYRGTVRNGQSVSQAIYRTVGVCQNCGYTWDPNEPKEEYKPKRKTWLWVVGWIMCFPIPLTILLLRNKSMKPAVKYGIIIVMWLLFFAIGIAANNSEAGSQVNNQTSSFSQSVGNEDKNSTKSKNSHSEKAAITNSAVNQ
ncbi:MAG: hypothetical protein Q4C99_09250 [Clostridia bacterium]|nr:hypothetical protein [Clostridia bacterium]